RTTPSAEISKQPSSVSAPPIASSDLTAPGRTARWRDSTAPCRSSGPIAGSIGSTPSAAEPCKDGCGATTPSVPTVLLEVGRQSAACHEPRGQVHLGLSEGHPAPGALSTRGAGHAPA